MPGYGGRCQGWPEVAAIEGRPQARAARFSPNAGYPQGTPDANGRVGPARHQNAASPSAATQYETPPRKPRRPVPPDFAASCPDLAGYVSSGHEQRKRSYRGSQESRVVIGPHDEYKVQTLESRLSFYESIHAGAAGTSKSILRLSPRGNAKSLELERVGVVKEIPQARSKPKLYKQSVEEEARQVSHPKELHDGDAFSRPAGEKSHRQRIRLKAPGCTNMADAAGAPSRWHEDKARGLKGVKEHHLRTEGVGGLVYGAEEKKGSGKTS